MCSSDLVKAVTEGLGADLQVADIVPRFERIPWSQLDSVEWNGRQVTFAWRTHDGSGGDARFDADSQAQQADFLDFARASLGADFVEQQRQMTERESVKGLLWAMVALVVFGVLVIAKDQQPAGSQDASWDYDAQFISGVAHTLGTDGAVLLVFFGLVVLALVMAARLQSPPKVSRLQRQAPAKIG